MKSAICVSDYPSSPSLCPDRSFYLRSERIWGKIRLAGGNLWPVGRPSGELDFEIAVEEHLCRASWSPGEGECCGQRHWRRRAIYIHPSRQDYLRLLGRREQFVRHR